MMKKLNDFPSRTEKVVINQLGVDETYQRPVSKAKVNKIVKNFNPIGMGPILVSEKEKMEVFGYLMVNTE